jgi:sugar phosphate isomerase/epimerase
MSALLGVNHMFLYPQSIVSEKIHKETLSELAKTELVDALDCWLWRGNTAKEEAKILLSSGKIINYNIGDRFEEAASNPASPDKGEREEAYSRFMREIEYALSLNSKKIVFGSGKDYASDRYAAKERFFEFVMKLCENVPTDVTLCFEPTDRDIDKCFLYGPLDETLELTKRVRSEGFENFGILLDMCHVPLMHETLESALLKSLEYLVHVHLGNCVIKNKTNLFYGDKHPAWDCPDGEYSSADAINFVKMLKKGGYIDKSNSTVSFEMRTFENVSANDSLKRFVETYKAAISEL